MHRPDHSTSTYVLSFLDSTTPPSFFGQDAAAVMSSKAHVEARCRAECIRLHDFFVDWFLGKCENTDEAYEGVTSALAPSFSMIVPSGSTVDLPDLLERLRSAYGVHAENGIVIEIRNVEMLDSTSDGMYLVRYEEWQRIGNNPIQETGRISTALLREEDGGPNNLTWIHVHETWMPGKGPP